MSLGVGAAAHLLGETRHDDRQLEAWRGGVELRAKCVGGERLLDLLDLAALWGRIAYPDGQRCAASLASRHHLVKDRDTIARADFAGVHAVVAEVGSASCSIR